MSGIATAIVGGSIVSGIIGSNASQGAANTQAAAADTASNNTLAATQQSNALQYQMYLQNLANQSPYMQGGQEAYSALLGAMGLGAPQAYGSSTGPTGSQVIPNATAGGGIVPTQGGGVNQTLAGGSPTGLTTTGSAFKPTGAVAGTSGVAVPGSTSGIGSTIGPTTNIPGIGNVGVQNFGAGQGSLNSANSAFSGQLGQTFNNSDLNAQLAPNYQFQLDQGEQALKASMAATGSLQTGQGLKNINDYAQNQASGAYQQAFNNWNTQQNNLYTRLQGLIAPGTSAASSAGQAAQSAGSGIASTTMGGVGASNNYLTSGAAAQAAGQVGSANALSNAFSGGVNGYLGSQLLNGINSGGGSAASGVAPNSAGSANTLLA